jgi:5-methylcytosine-specific restriction protein A
MAVWPYNTPQWRALRRRKMAENVLCEVCLEAGRLVIATCVDHKIQVSAGGDPFPPLSGLTSMCDSCHAMKRQAERDGRPFVNKGADASGMPVDRNHPFYRDTTQHNRMQLSGNKRTVSKQHGTLTLPVLRRRGAGGMK